MQASSSNTLKNIRADFGEWLRKMAPLMVLIGLVVLFSFLSPNFMTFNNIILMLRQVSFATISAVGIMFVMISGAIDLSIGSQIVFTNIILAISLIRRAISRDSRYASVLY